MAIGYVAGGGQVVVSAPVSGPGVTWPHQVGVLPRQADCFQHRAGAAQLAAEPGAEQGAAVAYQVVAGMGGVGKTQLAAFHARQLWARGEIDLLVWVTATGRAAVVSAYAQAAGEVLDTDPTDPERAARAFLAWLEPKSGMDACRWLIVLDDVGDPADLRGLWPPVAPGGRTVVTSRRRDAAMLGRGRRLVPVDLFTADESLTYLTTALAAHGRLDPPAELAALADDLGHLPLALSQAAAYLVDAGVDCATYRTLLADRARALADLLPDASELPDDQAATLAATWSLSIARADRNAPDGPARVVLGLLSVLDPNGVPDGVLTGGPVLGHLAAAARTGLASPDDLVRILRILHRLSLIDHTPGNPHQAVRVHQLVQRAAFDDLAPGQRRGVVRAAADGLVAAWPQVERDTALATVLRANCEALRRCAEAELWEPAAHPVLIRAGHSIGESGQVAAARTHFEQLARAARDRLGPDHPDTLAVRAELARWQGEAGDPAGAAAAFTALLGPVHRVLGPDHDRTLAARHELA
ncbi:NB-ARC domain-containing protein, partial [Kitasatospora sp. NPDC058965]|uniref:NB-ARC domain-containing protein n=1 Tax=Kitasatospora sp. NPDC058965 TaxID=3346682 RepID=UPI00369E1B5D